MAPRRSPSVSSTHSCPPTNHGDDRGVDIDAPVAVELAAAANLEGSVEQGDSQRRRSWVARVAGQNRCWVDLSGIPPEELPPTTTGEDYNGFFLNYRGRNDVTAKPVEVGFQVGEDGILGKYTGFAEITEDGHYASVGLGEADILNITIENAVMLLHDDLGEQGLFCEMTRKFDSFLSLVERGTTTPLSDGSERG